MDRDISGDFNSQQEVLDYVNGTSPHTSVEYHLDRLRAVSYLLKNLSFHRIIDFGCGDGMVLKNYRNPLDVVGIDKSKHAISLAKDNLSHHKFTGYVGGVGSFKLIEGEFDLLIAIDVLGYLSDDEEITFFKEANRCLKLGGFLLIMTGNELFDLFALNSGTVDFFQRNFDQQVSPLLTYGNLSRFKNAKRKNPLNFSSILATYGFFEKEQAFSQYHHTSPGLKAVENAKGEHRLTLRDNSFDPNSLPDTDRWKSLLNCSIFASLSIKTSHS